MAFLSASASSVLSKLPTSPSPVHGKTILITGASSGIGLVSARVLAKAGAHVVMAVRNMKKAAEVVASFGDVAPGSCTLMELDLSSLASVPAFVAEFNKRPDGAPLHVLMLNAGIFMDHHVLTVDKLEEMFQVHVVAHYLLLRMLQPNLELGAPSRVIWISSAVHLSGKMRFPTEPGKVGFLNDSPKDIASATDGIAG